MTCRSRLCLLLCTLPLLAVSGVGCHTGSQKHFQRGTVVASRKQATPVNSSAIEELLRSQIATGHLAELRWPDYSDYQPLVTKFYESGSYETAWMEGSVPTVQALEVIKALQASESKGLDPEDYDGSRWAGRIAALNASTSDNVNNTVAQFDLALTVCAMRYVSDIHIGKVNPAHFDFGINVAEKKYDLPLFLSEKLVGASDVQPILDAAEPPFLAYQRTKVALQQYLQLAKNPAIVALPLVDKPLAVGGAYSAIPQLSALLQMLGDMPAAAGPATTVIDAQLSNGLKNFQKRHGLTQSGVLNKETITQLNVPMAARVRQLQDALERYRWLSPEFSQPPLVVNIPEFRLRAFDANRAVAIRMNVVVGKSFNHQTPIFTDNMKYLVFRPYWNVPPGIQRSEIVPSIQRDRMYLAKKNFEVTDAAGNIVSTGEVSDEVLQGLRRGRLMVRERPGPKNSLGLAKFIFPNSHNVYLHGTPAQSLFAQSRRDFSHGCIRLESPADLAAWVLRDKPEWTKDKIKAAMETGPDNQQINLTNPIPVLILYVTAVVEEDGGVYFFNDIYGLDQSLDAVLAKGYPISQSNR
jgi:murein L,D-transpeptidase YcbB/YkuD